MRRVIRFLELLCVNNNREWFAANKALYEEANHVFGCFAAELIERIGEFDPAVRGLGLKDCTYRIYRDTRFSNDKTPYKTHFGVYVCPGGKRSGNAGYYFHVGRNTDGDCNNANRIVRENLLDAGIYMPVPEVLRSVRDEIFDNGDAIQASVVMARKGGFELDRTNSLKRTPKGYPTDSEHDELLRLKDLHLTKIVDDDYILAPDLARRAADDFRATTQFMALAQRAAQFAHEGGNGRGDSAEKFW